MKDNNIRDTNRERRILLIVTNQVMCKATGKVNACESVIKGRKSRRVKVTDTLEPNRYCGQEG